MNAYIFVSDLFMANADASYALAMARYMKNKFDFYGVNATKRKEIFLAYKANFKLQVDDNEFWELIEKLWDDSHRECQYLALDILRNVSKKLTSVHLLYLEKLIVHKSWWDSVDGIAPSLVGPILLKESALIPNYIHKWIDSDNMWLQRSAIIFQLKYKEKTDWDLLCHAILAHDTSKEFFIRKAQGWALRQYADLNPTRVYEFILANPQLSGLTKKEALRKLKLDI